MENKMKIGRKTWKVGVSPWAGVRPECLSVSSSSECEPGTEMIILEAFANLLQVDLEFITSPVPGCGKQLDNGTWTGIMGMLQTGEIDIVGNLCVMYDDRIDQNFSDFSYPAILDSQHFIIKVPKSSYMFEMRAPFQQHLWFTVVGFCVLFLCLHIIALNIYCKLPLMKALDLSLREMLHSVAGCDNQNGTIPIIWNIFTVYLGFISILYSMYITAALCRPISIDKPFSNSLEMSEKIFQGDYKIVSYKEKPNPKLNGLALDLFEKGISKNGIVFHRLAETQEQMKDLLDLIEESTVNLIFVADKSWINFYLQASRNSSNFWLIDDEDCQDSLFAYFYRKGFELSAALNEAIILVGDYKYNVQRRNRRSSEDVHEENRITDKSPEMLVISLKLINGPFVLYFCCIGVSILVAFLEIIVYHFYNKKKST